MSRTDGSVCRTRERGTRQQQCRWSALPFFPRAFWRQTCLVDFVNQSSIADLQDLGGLVAIPVIDLQQARDEVAFHFTDGLLGDDLQRNRAVFGDVNRDRQECTLPQELVAESLLVFEDHVACHGIFQFADVPGPVAMLEQLHDPRRKTELHFSGSDG